MSTAILETLAGDSFERSARTFGIGHFAMRKTEIELGAITLQMLLGNVVERPDQSTLEQSEVGLNSLGVNVPAHVFPDHVVNGVVLRKLALDLAVLASRIRKQRGIASDLLHEDRLERFRGDVRHMERAHVPVTLDQREYLVLVASTPRNLRFALAPVESFVGFDNLARSAERRIGLHLERFADAMRHEPRGLVGDPEHPVKLVRADPFLRRAHKVRGHQPLVKRNLGTLENCSDRDGELLAAIPAEIQARTVGLAVQLYVALKTPAMRAYRAIGPYLRLKVFPRFIRVLEVGLMQVAHGCLQLVRPLSGKQVLLSSI